MPTGREIMERAGVLLQDTTYVRWPLSELCTWINEAQRAIVLAKPSASAATRILQLVEGTRQTVPTTGNPVPLRLLDVRRNLKSTQASPREGGRIITTVSRAVLDGLNPNWHDSRYQRFKAEVRHAVFDEEAPLEYYVYPGNTGTGIVEALLSQVPTPLVASGAVDEIASYAGDIGLPEPYSVPILDYVMYRAQSKDDTGGNPGRAAAHYAQFATAIGLKIQVESATSPNRRRAET